MKNNIVFLDIDGVCNSRLYLTSERYKRLRGDENGDHIQLSNINRPEWFSKDIDTEIVNILNQFCTKTNSDVVISSSWRLGRTIDEMREILKLVGATFNIIDFTPHNRFEGSVRGNEVKAWWDKQKDRERLVERSGVKAEEVKDFKKYDNYIIFDDDSDFLLEQRHNFFQTDGYIGLTPTILYKAHRFLTGEDIYDWN